eukprot:1657863-Amphidinium_carterae.1
MNGPVTPPIHGKAAQASRPHSTCGHNAATHELRMWHLSNVEARGASLGCSLAKCGCTVALLPNNPTCVQ